MAAAAVAPRSSEAGWMQIPPAPPAVVVESAGDEEVIAFHVFSTHAFCTCSCHARTRQTTTTTTTTTTAATPAAGNETLPPQNCGWGKTCRVEIVFQESCLVFSGPRCNFPCNLDWCW